VADTVQWARMVIAAPDGTRLTVPLTGDGPPNLAVVEALARFALMTRRAGNRMWLEDVSPVLGDLLDLAGLRQTLAGPPRPPAPEPSGGQVIRQAERREQVLGVQEEVQPGDAVP
jgi:hypothetical protein